MTSLCISMRMSDDGNIYLAQKTASRGCRVDPRVSCKLTCDSHIMFDVGPADHPVVRALGSAARIRLGAAAEHTP